MDAVASVPTCDEGAGDERGHGDEGIGAAERPSKWTGHPVAEPDIAVHHGLGSTQLGQHDAQRGVAWPVGGMDDVDPFAAHGSGQPDHTTNGAAEGLHPAKATGAGRELADVERVDPQPGNVPDQPVHVGRSVAVVDRQPHVDLVVRRIERSDRLGQDPHVGPERRLGLRAQEQDTVCRRRRAAERARRAGSGPPSSCSTVHSRLHLLRQCRGPRRRTAYGNHRSNAGYLPSFEDGTTSWTYTPLFMSQLGLGCARLGSIAAASGRRSSIRLVHEAVDHGIGWFDTADAYTGGTSESLLGVALRRRRERVQIATKGGFVFADRGPLGRALRLASAPLLARLPRRHSAPAAAPPGPGGGTR